MVKTNSSWLFPPHCSWQSPNLSCMSRSLEPARQGCVPAHIDTGAYMLPASMGTPAFSVPGIWSLNSHLHQGNETRGLPQGLPSRSRSLLPAAGPYFKENHAAFCPGLGHESVAPNSVAGSQRRFVVFNHCGNETKLLYSLFYPAVQKPVVAATKLFDGRYLQVENHGAKMEQINHTNPKMLEVSAENYLSGEEREMHEDTEEINALLYSEEDDFYDDDNDDDDVKSTGHSPVLSGGIYGLQEQPEEDITQEVAGSDVPNKRQKLLDGRYKKSSPGYSVSSVKVKGPDGSEDNGESSCAIGQTQQEEFVSGLGNKQSRKDKIRATLKILKRIIPDANDKDPLSLLDEAIDYLKSLRHKAKALGMSYH